MRNWTEQLKRLATPRWLTLALLVLCAPYMLAQETTGGIQGVVKDPSGAVVARAHVVVTGPTLVGSKEVVTDASGYYRFTNLPPGAYVLTVKAQGFDTLKREGLTLEVGHLPTVDLELRLGAVNTVIEVNTEGPQIDTTTTTTLTNIPEQELANVPHGTSFQSVIQFAPMARNEPLMGNNTNLGNGSGGTSPGNGSNGGAFGFSVGGGADSENAYLVEGQETANIIGGYSHTNVPMDFIQEIEMKTSGVEAEYGGALGGVVNVIMRKGTANWHGSIFSSFENENFDGSPVAYQRYDPAGVTLPVAANGVSNDPNFQLYQPLKDKTADVYPGFTVGGPLAGLLPKVISDPIYSALRDRIYMFVGYNPEFLSDERWVNYGAPVGKLPFSQNQHTEYSTARVDAEATHRIRVFGSWLYQGQKESGETFPYADSTTGLVNISAGNGADVYAHLYGYAAPNMTVNTGGDITLTKSLVSTTRFGYYFENYHDFGYPSPSDIYEFLNSGIGESPLCPSGTAAGNCPTWPSNLNEGNGYLSAPVAALTHFNASKHIQLDEAVSWFKSGRFGTHNVKAGYQLNRESNKLFQGENGPQVEVYPGGDQLYTIESGGIANCQAEVATYGKSYGKYNKTTGALIGCTGTYGYATVYDIGTGGSAISYNNALFGQDAWTLGKGLTINFGLRIEKEYLPAEATPAGAPARPINFGWGDKIEPRIGAAWDVFKDGKMKVFGEYGVFNDIMKLNLAISSFGGAYWQNCTYLMNSPDYTTLTPSFDSNGRYCSGTGQANFPSGGAPSSTDFPYIENANFRTDEGAVPHIKPYRQHETVFGVDYQLKQNLAFEARWDRRRLDHAIEDAAIYNPGPGYQGEIFEIVNPGEGANATWNSYYQFLFGTPGNCGDCGPNPKAARSYDGLEFSLKKSISQGWFGTFSYTYSSLRGNYSGLTDSDLADGGGGRNSPNNSRAFDEPFFYYTANGTSANGPLATDRPNTLKGNAYYDLPWSKFGLGSRNATDFGIFQVAYQGSPLSSYVDVGETYGPGEGGAYFDYTEGRGKWTDVSQSPTSGAITVGNTYARRTGFYTQTDFNLKHTLKLKESSAISFDGTLSNLFNQRAVTAYGSEIDSNNYGGFLQPGGLNLASAGTVPSAAAYSALEHPYDWKTLLTTNGITVDSMYGKPMFYQLSRKIRIAVHFTF